MTNSPRETDNSTEVYYKCLVLESLIEEHGFDEPTAQKLIDGNITFNRMLRDRPDFAMRYDPEYWADKIAGVRKEAMINEIH
jgi:hypothetical protein